jgi:hypothetical protein
MNRLLLALLLAPLAQADLVLATWNGTIETPITASVVQLPSVEAGETATLRLRVRNTGTTADTITRFTAAGAGFSLERLLPPQVIQPGQFQNATLTFQANAPANYSANLQMNGVSVLVLISVTSGAALVPQAPCQVSGTGKIAFGTAVRGTPVSCGFQLRNETSSPVSINSISITGSGFTAQNSPAPVTIAPGASASFAVQLDAQARGPITGTLRVNARDYALEANGEDPPLQNPSIDFGSAPTASAQQRQIRLRFSAPAAIAASGFLDLTFERDPAAPADDPAVTFLEAGARRVLFRVAQGQTDATFDGAPFVTLQTGSTAGQIRLTLSGVLGGYTGDPAVILRMAPAVVVADKIVATRFPDRIELAMTGIDNTFTTGSMLFRFYDGSGQQITAAIPANFTSNFKTFFTSINGGSAFKLTVQFPLSGDGSSIAGMEAELSNSAGTLRTGRLGL